MPVSIGSAPRSCLNASSPPAEAPTPTMGKALSRRTGLDLALLVGHRLRRSLS